MILKDLKLQLIKFKRFKIIQKKVTVIVKYLIEKIKNRIENIDTFVTF